MKLGEFGVWRRVGELTPDMASDFEAMGYGAVWVGGSPPEDLEAVEEVVAATRAVPVITGIVNMWRADPSIVAASYHRIEARHPGRFILGLGIGHPEATRQYRRPFATIVEYLERMEEAGVPAERMMLAALGPRVLELAAQRTAGAHPYLTTPRHTRMARSVMGQDSLLAPEQKVVLDPQRWQELARPNVARYLKLVNYRNSLIREGWEKEDLDGSDRLVRELVLAGDPAEVVALLRAHVVAGADHVGIQVLGEDPRSEYGRLASALFG